jgi:RHS repeat-associated protein
VTSAGSRTFSYDGNGNLISGTDGRSNSYTVFNKPYAMSRAGSTVTIDYGPNRERYRRLDNVSGQVAVTHTVGSIEKITRPGPVIEIKRYLDGEAIETISGSTRTTEYLFTDHLGSVDVITHASGSVVQSMAFDAFGRRRDAVDYDAFTDPMIVGFDTTKTTRGFTFHEQLDPVGLIHMNGRVYDPTLGRFLSPDPFVQDPGNTQSLNRYSYVFNNPLSHTDPSGYFSLKEAVGAGLSIATFAFCQACSASIWAAMATGAATGFAGTYVATGSVDAALKGAVLGGASAAAFYQIGQHFAGIERVNDELSRSIAYQLGLPARDLARSAGSLTLTQTIQKIAAHAVVGGVMSALGGGKFGHGFLSAGIAQAAAGPIRGIGDGAMTVGARFARIVSSAIVGGTTSRITGGNFANGAIVAAFSRTFNDEHHDESSQESERRRLPVYSGEELQLSDAGANEVFDAFFGHSRTALDPMTDLDRSFAQALYVEAVSASEAISRISWLTVIGAGHELISLPHVAMELANHLGDRGDVNVTIMRKMRTDWREEYNSRAHNGEYISYGR